MPAGSNVRNTITTHPNKSDRRERALERIAETTKQGNSNAAVIATLQFRIGKPPRAWKSQRV